ncbi:PKD domain-containing protein [Crocinitomicaceae bacterium]|nr:PKD domain-containing protein [Crocinitomicaceae bacterium]
MKFLLFLFFHFYVFVIWSQPGSLIFPKNNHYFEKTPIRFNWNEYNSNYLLIITQDSSFTTNDTIIYSSINSVEFNNELNDGTWYWKVLSIGNTDTIISPSSKFNIVDLNSFDEIKIRFSASENQVDLVDNRVASWSNQISNNYNASQSVNARRPFFIENISNINDRGGVEFDGSLPSSYDYLNIDSISLTDLECFIVGKGLDNRNRFLRFGSIGYSCNWYTIAPGIIISINNSIFFEGPQETNKYQCHNFGFMNGQLNSPNTFLNINGTAIQKLNNTTNGSDIINNFDIGYALSGTVSEILIFDNLLNTNNRLSTTNVLLDKYAPPINLGEDLIIDYGFCDTTLIIENHYQNFIWSTGDTTSSIIINEPGLYWVETTDIFGRISKDTIIVEKSHYDQIILQNQLICFNETDSISANIPIGNYTFIQWSDGNTNLTRVLNQNEAISYTLSDSLGCLRTSNIATISIDNSLENITLGVDTSLCSGNTIQLIQDTAVISNWLWNTLDTTSTLSIDTSGIYILDVFNNNGCQNSDSIEVNVIGTAPSLSYSIENDICQGSEFSYSENSTVPPGNTIEQVIWDFGDLDSSFNSNGSYVYIDSGSFTASLQVSTLEGCSSQDEFTITVHPKPITTFETTNYCPYEEISFSASNSYDVPLESYQWEFGQNGNTSIDSNPSYFYGLSGNYEVELISVDTNNCIDTVIQNVFIQPAPVADISILNPCEYAIWNLTDNSNIADTFQITTYEWNYGDGTNSINPGQGKYYENYGEYAVQLVLTGNNGCVDTTEQNITVHPNPVINYQVGPACKNTWTKFENLSTIPQGTLAETNWLFNLQFEDSATNTSFNFPTTGIQLLTLTSTSDQGCIVDTIFTVDVSEELSASFYCDPQVLVSDIPINFLNTSLSADSSYWDFGDGDGLNFNNNIENNISYSSALNGSYLDIILMTVNDLGCRDTLSKTLLVNEAYYDVSIETLYAQDINGYLTIGVEIANLGTIPLENLVLTLKTPENGPIQENLSGSILQGDNEIYIFNAKPSAFISNQDATERFVCVEAQNANISTYLDINQENNTKCKNIEGSGFALVSVYPNPTDEDITISILLSETSNIYVELFDQTGRKVYKNKNIDLENGIHNFYLPLSLYDKGIYLMKISDGNKTEVKRILIR